MDPSPLETSRAERLAEMGVGAIMQLQPSLQVKQDAIRRYADEVIARFN